MEETFSKIVPVQTTKAIEKNDKNMHFVEPEPPI